MVSTWYGLAGAVYWTRPTVTQALRVNLYNLSLFVFTVILDSLYTYPTHAAMHVKILFCFGKVRYLHHCRKIPTLLYAIKKSVYAYIWTNDIPIITSPNVLACWVCWFCLISLCFIKIQLDGRLNLSSLQTDLMLSWRLYYFPGLRSSRNICSLFERCHPCLCFTYVLAGNNI